MKECHHSAAHLLPSAERCEFLSGFPWRIILETKTEKCINTACYVNKFQQRQAYFILFSIFAVGYRQMKQKMKSVCPR